MYLHDGGYDMQGSMHPPNGLNGTIPCGLLEHCESINHTFSVEYRLSINPAFPPSPAALLDPLAGHAYLVRDVGFHPSNIFVAGDSTGRSLAIALTRYLVENTRGDSITLPAPPGALILICPWADMGVSHCMPGGSFRENLSSDILSNTYEEGDWIGYDAAVFVGPRGVDLAPRNRYASPPL
jgi:hypothetical protein